MNRSKILNRSDIAYPNAGIHENKCTLWIQGGRKPAKGIDILLVYRIQCNFSAKGKKQTNAWFESILARPFKAAPSRPE
jgi:hypothetical protein